MIGRKLGFQKDFSVICGIYLLYLKNRENKDIKTKLKFVMF